MSLKKQFLTILLGVMVCSFLAVYFVMYFGVLNSFEKIEKKLVEVNALRLMNNIQSDIEKIRDVTKDYSAWDDSYIFLQDHNQKYIEANLVPTTFTNLNLDVFAAFDKNNKLVYATTHNEDFSQTLNISPQLEADLLKNPFLYTHQDTKSLVMGVFVLDQKAYMLSSRPVTKSQDDGTSTGTIIFLKEISTHYLQKLSERSQMHLGLFNIEGALTINGFPEKRLPETLKNNKGIFINTIGDNKIFSNQILYDLQSRPLLLVEITQDRTIFKEGTKTMFYTLGMLISIFIFIFGTIFIFTKFRIYASLERLLKGISHIGESKNLDYRINLSRYVEFAVIGKVINDNLELLSQADKDKKQLQMQVLHTSKLASLGTLAAGVAHEINNPLMISQGHLQIIQDTLEEEGKLSISLRQKFGKLFSSIERMRTIIEGLTTYSREDAQEDSLINIKDVVEDAITFSKDMFRKESIQLETNFSMMEAYIMGSSGKVQQIILNFLTNARDALMNMDPPRENAIIKVSIEVYPQDDKFICLSVADNGLGISEANLTKIFEPFFTTKPEGKGTGLGLPIVQGIVREMNGKIDVQTKLGEGTTFRVIFPNAKKMFKIAGPS